MKVQRLVCSALIIAAGLQGQSSKDGGRGPFFSRARVLFYQASAGDTESLEHCAELLLKLVEQHPADSLIAAYLGSTRILQSSTSHVPWRKGKLVKEGLKMLDSAVSASVEDLEIRFLRGVSTHHLPGFFGRKEESPGRLPLYRIARGGCSEAGPLRQPASRVRFLLSRTGA